MLFKLPNFFLCLGCFLFALVELFPANDISNVHRELRNHFGLNDEDDGAKAVKSLQGIYDYALSFERKNEELQATSAKYWCERRYAEHLWNHSRAVPHWECPSPRLYALHFSDDKSHSWTSQCGAGRARMEQRSANSASSAHCQGAPSSATGRRLAGGSEASVRSTSPGPTCEDDDAGLAIEENDANYTCAGHAEDICGVDLGLRYCKFTCGYCGPFQYDHTHLFPKPLLTLMPVMMHQTRYEATECHGFAHVYEHQPHNEALYLFPALDGRRTSRVITCIDRSKQYEEEYAHVIPCPEGSPINHCYCPNSTRREGPDSVDCSQRYMYDTKKHIFHGETVYPRMLVDAVNIISSMKQTDWIDLQTAEVALSTLVYTEGLEIFTSLVVTFNINNAGSIEADIKLKSYRDLINFSKDRFVAQLLVTMVGASLGVCLSIWFIVRHPEECKWGYVCYELASRLLLLCYPLALLISWSMQSPMSEEFDSILHSFLDMPSFSERAVDEALDKYFEVKTHIYEETLWLKRQRIAAYIVLYIQFLQLIFYMNAHPKMAVLTSTLWRAFDNLVHFLLLFTVLFLMLAYLAHWLLGGDIEAFATFGTAISSQGRMIFGEFIYADGVEDLDDSMTGMYWTYAFTFMLLMFFTLLNFFLAIVVDAFADVKSEFEGEAALSNFVADISAVIYTRMQARRQGWPATSELIALFDKRKHQRDGGTWLERLESESEEDKRLAKLTVTPEELARAFPMHFAVDGGKRKALTGFVLHYYRSCEKVLVRRGARVRESMDESSTIPSQSEGQKSPPFTIHESLESRTAEAEPGEPEAIQMAQATHRCVQQQATQIAEQATQIAELTALVKAVLSHVVPTAVDPVPAEAVHPHVFASDIDQFQSGTLAHSGGRSYIQV